MWCEKDENGRRGAEKEEWLRRGAKDDDMLWRGAEEKECEKKMMCGICASECVECGEGWWECNMCVKICEKCEMGNTKCDECVVKGVMEGLLYCVAATVESEGFNEGTKSGNYIRMLGGVRKLERSVGRPRKRGVVSAPNLIQQKVYSAEKSSEKSLRGFHAMRSSRSQEKEKEMGKERTKKQLRSAKRKLEFGDMSGKHTLGDHEWKQPLKHGFPMMLIRQSVRSKFEKSFGQSAYRSERKGDPRMMRNARRYRQVLAEYELKGTRLKEALVKLRSQLNAVEKEWKRYGEHCGFSREEIAEMEAELGNYEKLEMKARKKVGSYRILAIRAGKGIARRILAKRNGGKEHAKMKSFVVWRSLERRCESMRVRVRECKRAMECAEKVKGLQNECRKRRVADLRLLHRLRMSRWRDVDMEQKKTDEKGRYEEKKRRCLSWVVGRRILDKYRRRAMRAGMQYVQKGTFVKVSSFRSSDQKMVAFKRQMEMVKHHREVVRETNNAMMNYWKQLDRLKVLSGDVSRQQRGTRVQREAKEAKWLDTVICGIRERSVGVMRECSAAKKKVMLDALDSDMVQVLSVKGQLFSKFVSKYRVLAEKLEKWKDLIEESDGEITCEDVLRPKEAMYHVRSEKEMGAEELSLEYDENGEAWCVDECGLPDRWALRMWARLGQLKSVEECDVVECLESVMEIDECDGCVMYSNECEKGKDECEDVIRLMLRVRGHSCVIRTLLRQVYELRAVAKKLIDVDTVLLNGKASDLRALLLRIGQTESEEEQRNAVYAAGRLPGPVTAASALKELYGRVAERFEEIEKDHPCKVCRFCERLLRRKKIQMRVKQLTDIRMEKSRENFKISLLRWLGKNEWDEDVDQMLLDETRPLLVCKTCWKYVKEGEIGGPMLENEMWVDEAPRVLMQLNMFEQFLVERVRPFYSIVKLQTCSNARNVYQGGLVSAVKGNVAHMRLSTEVTASHVLETMPLSNVEDTLRIYALSLPTKDKKLWKNLVDMAKVLEALEWLKGHNPAYRGIVIDKEAAKKIDATKFVRVTGQDEAANVDPNLEREDEQWPELQRMLSETMLAGVESEYVMQATEDARVTPGDHAKTYQQVRMAGVPVSFNSVPDLDVMCMPQLFSQGRGGVAANRVKAEGMGRVVRPREYLQYRLQHSSGTFRRTPRFLHVGHYLKRERGVNQGVYGATKTGCKLGKMNAKQVLDGVKANDETVERDLCMAFGSLKGSQEYWSRVKGDLHAMDENLGPATFFVTLSCAEYQWVECEKYLREVNADLEGVEKMSRQQLIVKDPVSVAEFFERRFMGMLNEVIAPKAKGGEPLEGPLGIVEHYFWRLEYQARGAPHIHMKVWVRDAPVLGVNSKAEVLAFIAKYITAKFPNEQENSELFELVKRCQVHRCTKSCKKFEWKKGGGGLQRCRYGYPMIPCENYELNDFEESVKSHVNRKKRVTKLYNLPRGESEEEKCVNPYNPCLLSLWKANMDVQYLGESSQILNGYITGYMTKGEKNATEGIWESLSEDSSVSSKVMKILYARFRDREVGAYEMADDLLGHALHGSSDQVVYLGVGMPGMRSRKLKPYQMLKRMSEESTEILETNLIENYYPNRHEALEELSLHEIVRDFLFHRKKKGGKVAVKEKAAGGDENEEERDTGDEDGEMEELKEWWGTDGLGYFTKRKKSVIVKTKYVSCTVESAEMYFQSLIQQYVPYRKEEELLRGESTYREAFDEWAKDPKSVLLNAAKIRREKMEEAIELRKRYEEAGTKEEMEGQDVHEESDRCLDPIQPDGFRAQEDYLSEEGLVKREKGLNERQKAIYDEVVGEIRKQMDGNASSKQVLKFVSGGAGVGKSKLIEVLTEGVEMLAGKKAVVLAAPTGMAAQNIGGRTMHGVFRLPVHTARKWAYRQLFPEQAKLMYDEIGKTKLFVIDEISMVSNVMLAFLHMRLAEMSGSAPGVPFGGYNLIVLGDLMQLPPIGEKGLSAPQVYRALGAESMKKIFPGTVLTRFPVSLWRSFEYAELTENMRQAEDKSYAELLNEVRMGKISEMTKATLDQRLVDVSHDVKERAKFVMKKVNEGESPLCLMSKRKDVAAINLCMLLENQVTPVLLHAIDQSLGRKKAKMTKSKGKGAQDMSGMTWENLQEYVDKATKRKEQETGGLADVVVIGVGARVMLRKNIDVSKGQYNGALGIVKRIVMNNRMPDGVSAVLVKFDGIEESVEVKRTTATYHLGQAIEVKREQFPLTLAYAMTIHKSQGLSLDCVVCDLQKAIFACGMSYVVLSRVRKLSGLFMFGFEAKSVRCDRLAVIEYNRLRTTIGLPMFEVPSAEVVETRKVLKRTLEIDLISGNEMPVVKKLKIGGTTVAKKTNLSGGTEKTKGTESSLNVGTVKKKKLLKRVLTGPPKDDAEYERFLRESDKCNEASSCTENAKSAKVSEESFVALRNPLFQCYANSAVQALLSCGEKMYTWVLSDASDAVGALLWQFFDAKRNGMKGRKRLEVKELVQYVRQTRSATETDFPEQMQHDSSEFLIALLKRSVELEAKFRVRKKMEYKCSVCGHVSEGPVEETWDCVSMNLNDEYGGSVRYSKLRADNLVLELEKECVVCQVYLQKHVQSIKIEVLPETENVIVRIGRFGSEGWGEQMVVRRVDCAITEFDPDNVLIGETRMEVCCAVLYNGVTGKDGHYYVYVRNNCGSWWELSDESRPVKRQFVKNLDQVAYMVLRKPLRE